MAVPQANIDSAVARAALARTSGLQLNMEVSFGVLIRK
jgi:hypothetical protein